MNIGIIGAGQIGGTLARKLAAAGHEVKIANSKGPETLTEFDQETNIVAVRKEDAVKDVEVVILSLPFTAYAALSDLFDGVPEQVVVIDTSNYYPFRDGEMAGIDGGEAESLWVSQQIGRPIVKAWNAALAATLADEGAAAGSAGRVALPVAGDGPAKSVAMQLVDGTGFDALDAGSLADSWRQQPGTPAYCTELKRDALQAALGAADRERAPRNREAILQEIMPRWSEFTHEDTIAMNRSMTA